MTAVNTLLERLDKVRETGPGRWIACCPAHDDRHPSLSIRETDDGTLLIRCWAGCGAADVVTAVGLGLRDLFPDTRPLGRLPLKPRERWVPADVLRCLSSEITFVQVCAAALRQGETLADADHKRLAIANGRIDAAAREAGK